MKRHLTWFGLVFVVVVLDQVTKYMAEAYLMPYQPIIITSFFNLHLVYNIGAAFSFLSNAGSGWQNGLFAGIAVVVCLVIVHWLYRLPTKATLTALALALILGGAIGNLIDRVARGQVVDFLDFHLGIYHWPVFNLADTAITVGAFILIVLLLTNKQN